MQDHPHRFWIPAYAVATALVSFPLMDLLVQVWPLQLLDATWRFGAVGLSSRMFLTPALGLLVYFGVAMVSDHRRFLRVLALGTGLVSVLWGLGAGLFVLDRPVVRSVVNEETLSNFDLTSRLIMLKLGLALLPLLAITAFGWKAGAWARPKKKKPGIVAARAPAKPRTAGASVEDSPA